MESHRYCFLLIQLSKLDKWDLLNLLSWIYRISPREDISAIADTNVFNNKFGKLDKFSKLNKLDEPAMYLHIPLSELWMKVNGGRLVKPPMN